MNYHQFRQWLINQKVEFSEGDPYKDSDEITKNLECYKSFITSNALVFTLNNGEDFIICSLLYSENKLAKKVRYEGEILGEEKFQTKKISVFYKIIKKFITSKLKIEEVIRIIQEYDSKIERLGKIAKQIESLRREETKLNEEIRIYSFEENKDKDEVGDSSGEIEETR